MDNRKAVDKNNEDASLSQSFNFYRTQTVEPDVNHFKDYIASSRGKTTKDTDEDFNANLKICLEALKAGVNPIRIQSGTSGSYFIRNINNEYIAIFKPKDEEPFAQANPKWSKYIQRLCCCCCFGRSCLVPNSGYLSEAGASLVDEKLKLNIVPKTRVVKLSSPSFAYSASYRNKNEFRAKEGSYQIFVNGFKSAKEMLSKWSTTINGTVLNPVEIQKFKILFQKMCVLDYIIRNTDRHMDNWLVKYIPNESIDLAAIDNGLAFPVKHPEIVSRIRSFPFGWSQLAWAQLEWDETLRDHLLKKLTPQFANELCSDIRKLFKYDPSFNRFLLHNQMKVMRGQIWNLRCALENNETPAVMVKRSPVLVSRRHHAKDLDDDWNVAFRIKEDDLTNHCTCCS